MPITHAILKERQEWTLNQKIDHSLYVLEAFYTHTKGNCAVSFSGGKDSVVLLHLARSLYPEMKGVFCNTTNELADTLKFVRTIDNIDIVMPRMTFLDIIRDYGFPVVSKKVAMQVRTLKQRKPQTYNSRKLYLTGYNTNGTFSPAFKLSDKWLFLTTARFNVTEECCTILKHGPLVRYYTEHALHPIIGTMASNSLMRKQDYLKNGCNIFRGYASDTRSRPMSIWLDKDVWEYIRKFNVPYNPAYDKGAKNTGCAFCGMGCHLEKESRFDLLKKIEPKRYEQMMKLTNNGITYAEVLKIILNKRPRRIRKNYTL